MATETTDDCIKGAGCAENGTEEDIELATAAQGDDKDDSGGIEGGDGGEGGGGGGEGEEVDEGTVQDGALLDNGLYEYEDWLAPVSAKAFYFCTGCYHGLHYSKDGDLLPVYQNDPNFAVFPVGLTSY